MGKGASTDIVLSSTFEVFCAGRKDGDSPAARIKNNVLIFMVYIIGYAKETISVYK